MLHFWLFSQPSQKKNVLQKSFLQHKFQKKNNCRNFFYNNLASNFYFKCKEISAIDNPLKSFPMGWPARRPKSSVPSTCTSHSYLQFPDTKVLHSVTTYLVHWRAHHYLPPPPVVVVSLVSRRRFSLLFCSEISIKDNRTAEDKTGSGKYSLWIVYQIVVVWNYYFSFFTSIFNENEETKKKFVDCIESPMDHSFSSYAADDFFLWEIVTIYYDSYLSISRVLL